jgi:hypothetical protein
MERSHFLGSRADYTGGRLSQGAMTSEAIQEKQQVHEMIDRLGPGQLSAVRGLLQVLLDPV